MPQVLLLIAAGAGLILLRRILRKQQERIDADLRAAKEAMEQRETEQVPSLEKDPATGVYRPASPNEP